MTLDLALLVPAPGTTLRIAIIGANGHVGAAVVKQALSLGHSVLALDRAPTGCPEAPAGPAYEYRQFDATDSRAYGRELRGCTACVHLAAIYNVHDDEGKPMDDLSQAVSTSPVLSDIELGLTAGHPQLQHRHVVQCAYRVRRAGHQPGRAGVERELCRTE